MKISELPRTPLGYHWTTTSNVLCNVFALGEGFHVEFVYVKTAGSENTELFRAIHNREQVQGVIRSLEKHNPNI